MHKKYAKPYWKQEFTMPMHEQQFMFFSAEDVNNGVMDYWIKMVKIKQ
jgi:hypothetical protein